MNAYTLTWGVKGPVRVLILTGAQGELPEDLLDAARNAFESPLNFEVRVKLHPIRYNPSGRLLARCRDEIRHWFHMNRPFWRLFGVPHCGRMPHHWRLIHSTGWKDPSYVEHLNWCDVVVFNSTSLWKRTQKPLVHFIQRERQWDFNPAGKRATLAGDPLVLRYVTYALGRMVARDRGVPTWRRVKGITVLKEYGAL